MRDFNILTFHRAYNYGAVLQAYALQTFIEHLGYSAGVYDYISPYENRMSGLMSKVIRFVQGNRNESNKRMHSAYTEFVENELKLNTERDSRVFISGSDQVWNPCGPMDMTYYLGFVKKPSTCISYAASLGVSSIPEDRKTIIEEALNRFDYISVREESAKKQLFSLTGKEISVNIDPSLLLECHDWENLMKEIDDVPKDYILVYIMHYPKNINKLLRWLSDSTGSKIILIESQGIIQGNLCSLVMHDKVVRYATPYEFLWLFKNANYIVTSSFHGAAFSISFHKELYAIIDEKTDSRISNLLQKCSIQWISENATTFVRTNTDWAAVDNYLDDERNLSRKYIVEAYEHITKELSSSRENISSVYAGCSGCSACINVCPANAISVRLNSEGFYKASIDIKKCVHCGKCISICPTVKSGKQKAFKAYYGYNKDDKIIKKSSSGGVFHALATEILRKDGIVYSAVYSEDKKTVIFGSSNRYPLESFQKSKYVASDFSGVIAQVKQNLNEGKIVLVSGAPCQIAGLISSFDERPRTLLTVDFVCGGMPSALFWKEHIEEIEKKYGSRLDYIDFRSKAHGWGKMWLELSFCNGDKKLFREYQDSYYNSFLSYISLDKRCLSCQYHEVHHTDITIADFWGYENAGLEKRDDGLSLIICNTESGHNAIVSNPNLLINELDEQFARYAVDARIASGAYIAKRNEFFRIANVESFEAAAKKMCPTGKFAHIKPFVLNKIGRLR